MPLQVKFATFPAPLEVDRWIYDRKKVFMKREFYECFRPLARWIGSYTAWLDGYEVEKEFSAPLEVDRYLYNVKMKLIGI